MERVQRPATWSSHLLIAATAALLALAPTARALETSPAEIEFKNVTEGATLTLTHEGTPVPAGAIQAVKLLVGAHDYDHMIRVEKADGHITVHPTEQLQLGAYDLAIATTHGAIKVPVRALLGIVDASLEARAARRGVSVEAVKAQLGISQKLRRERIELKLPALYYLGQSLEISMPIPEGRKAMWWVNGEEIAPKDDGSFRYVFELAGVYDFGYVEKLDGAVVAIGLGTVQVVPEPPIAVSTAVGAALTLRAPEGYSRYEWMCDKAEAGSDAASTVTFDTPGTHVVTTRASEPQPGTAQAFRVITYTVTVE